MSYQVFRGVDENGKKSSTAYRGTKTVDQARVIYKFIVKNICANVNAYKWGKKHEYQPMQYQTLIYL